MTLDETNYRDSVLFRRRSIRRFKAGMPDQWRIKAVLEAAMCTQTACNMAPFELILIDDRGLLDRLQAVLPLARLKTAPAAILVTSQRRSEAGEHPSRAFIQQDLAAVSHQICLAASEFGLGACWCGLHPVERFSSAAAEVLGIPEDVMPFSIIPFGIPDEEKAPNEKWMPEKVHRNAY